jgi:predicted metalloprotease with PDZ domain
MEGFTSYYERLILRRAGFYSKEEMLNKIQGQINYVEGSVGSRVQPVAHASFDAWIKAYRPNENSGNTTMTYYSRGSVLGSVIDAMIISDSKGKKCMDHFLQHLYQKFYVELKRGFSEEEFRVELEKFTGEKMVDFFRKYVHGTEILPYAAIFDKVGVTAKDVTSFKPSFGAAVQDQGGKVVVKTVRSGSSAEDAGISPGDEIVGCNGYRLDKGMFDAMMEGLNLGDVAEVLVAREEKLFSVKVKMSNFRKPAFQLSPEKGSRYSNLYDYWLR